MWEKTSCGLGPWTPIEAFPKKKWDMFWHGPCAPAVGFSQVQRMRWAGDFGGMYAPVLKRAYMSESI